MKLAGRVAIVTGGGRGVGKGISLELARNGANVAINYHKHPEPAQETVKEIESLGRHALAVQADVRDYEQVKAMVAKTLDAFGKIDILINNAGLLSRGLSLADTDPAEMELMLNTHLFGPFYFCKAVLPAMRLQSRGDIHFISSVSASDCYPGQGPYAIAKAALETFGKILAKEELKNNIRVNIIACGMIETEMTKRAVKAVWHKDIKEVASQMPFGRVCQPDEVGKLSAFLCSEDGGYLSGHVIFIDGAVQAPLVK